MVFPVEGLDLLFAEKSFINRFFSLHVSTFGSVSETNHVQELVSGLDGCPLIGREGPHESREGILAVAEGSRETPGRGLAPKTIYRCAPFLPGTMSVLDLFRNECVNGKVLDKYRLNNGNVGLVVEDAATHRRYHVEFRDGYKGPSSENLFGLLKEPFAGKTEYLDRLVEAGDSIDLTLSYSRSPFREAYNLHSVLRSEPRRYNRRLLIELLYRHGAIGVY
jgi:hypothetical protein